MPKSPSQRTAEQTQGSSGGGDAGKAKRKSKPTTKKRNARQRTKERYSKAREDAQLQGIIPTIPEGALKPERVDPATQAESPLPAVVREALRGSWATPDSAKPAIISALLEPFYRDDVVMDEHGNEVHVKPSRKLLNELAKTLRMLDQTQWERDNPEQAGKAKGAGAAVSVSMQTNIAAIQLLNKMLDDPNSAIADLAALDDAGAPGDSRFGGQVVPGPAPEAH